MLQFTERPVDNYVPRNCQTTNGVLQTDDSFEKLMKLKERFSAAIRALYRPLFQDSHIPAQEAVIVSDVAWSQVFIGCSCGAREGFKG
jgi:hypothetical protein